MRFFSNKEIAKLLRDIAAAYSVKGGNHFKIIAYSQAADSVEHATSELKDIWEDGQLDTVPALGKNIQMYLGELFTNGSVKHFDDIKKGLPPAMFSFLNITGMGPKNAYKLASLLHLKNIDDLEKAAKLGKIRMLPSFGEKSEKEILKAIQEFKKTTVTRYPLPFAYSIAERVIAHMKTLDACQQVESLGSLRRMVATVGDIDIAVASNKPKDVINHFNKFREIARVLSSGEIASSILLQNGMQVDLKIQPPEAFGALLQHFTGSKYHNIKLREFALKSGKSLSEYGIRYKKKLHTFWDEKSLYNFLSLDYIEPELREDTGEIEAAHEHLLPKLINTNDIKGDLHIHSNYPVEPSHDFGKNNFETLIKRAKELKYQYMGLSDHSPSVSNHSSEQIIGLIEKRTIKIEQLKSSYNNIRILNLLEIDILTNGNLSVPEKGLSLLDGAIAGIHSSHTQSKTTITRRLLNAINSKKVKIISHPTGRLLLKRESYDADWGEVFKACARTNTFLEINAWPDRLDLPDNLIKEAVKKKVKMIINTDSHEISQMNLMTYGVSMARRGWAQKEDILNTLSYGKIKNIILK